MIAQEAQKRGEINGFGRVSCTVLLNRGIQGGIGRLAQVELVVPERQQTLARMAGHAKADPVGIGQNRFGFGGGKLIKTWQPMHCLTMNSESRPCLVEGRTNGRLSPIGNHCHPLQKG